MKHPITLSVFAAAALVGVASADSIDLRHSVRMPLDRDDIRLSDIAVLDGELVAAFAGVVVHHSDDPTILQKIHVEDVRAALNEADIAWATVHLSGGDVLIRPRPNIGAATPQALKPASIGTEHRRVQRDLIENPVMGAESLVKEATVRGEIARRMSQALRLSPGRVRIQFNESDTSLLARSIEDIQLEIDPLSSWMSDRVELTLRLWRDGRVAESQSIFVKPEILVQYVEAAGGASRGSVLAEDDVVDRSDWKSPTEARQLAHRVEAIGRVATRTLRSGEVIRSRDVEREAVITRGDVVNVRCLSGGVVITLQAEARSDASVGQSVELRKVGERDTFHATVSGPGEAVIQVSSH